jgi:hypothetical protein
MADEAPELREDASKHQAACHRHPYACKGASTDLMSPVGAFLDALLELSERVLDGLPRRVHCARHQAPPCYFRRAQR